MIQFKGALREGNTIIIHGTPEWVKLDGKPVKTKVHSGITYVILPNKKNKIHSLTIGGVNFQNYNIDTSINKDMNLTFKEQLLYLNLGSTFNINGLVEGKIMNLKGRQIFNFHTKVKNSNSHSLGSLPNMTPGKYFYTLKHGNQKYSGSIFFP